VGLLRHASPAFRAGTTLISICAITSFAQTTQQNWIGSSLYAGQFTAPKNYAGDNLGWSLASLTPGQQRMTLLEGITDGTFTAVTSSLDQTFVNATALPGVKTKIIDFPWHGSGLVAVGGPWPGVYCEFPNSDMPDTTNGAFRACSGYIPQFAALAAKTDTIITDAADFTQSGFRNALAAINGGQVVVAIAQSDGTWREAQGSIDPSFFANALQPGVRLVVCDWPGHGSRLLLVGGNWPGVYTALPDADLGEVGSFRVVPVYAPELGAIARQPGALIAKGDFTGDGLDDSIVAIYGGKSDVLSGNRSDGTFAPEKVGAIDPIFFSSSQQPGVQLYSGRFAAGHITSLLLVGGPNPGFLEAFSDADLGDPSSFRLYNVYLPQFGAAASKPGARVQVGQFKYPDYLDSIVVIGAADGSMVHAVGTSDGYFQEVPDALNLAITSVTPCGYSSAPLLGHVYLPSPQSYSLVAFVAVDGLLWPKPYWSTTVPVSANGDFTLPVVTGGNDTQYS
jgi:hypothetical protein